MEKVNVICFDDLPVLVMTGEKSLAMDLMGRLNYMMENKQYTYLKTEMVKQRMFIPSLLQGELTINKAKQLEHKRFYVHQCMLV